MLCSLLCGHGYAHCLRRDSGTCLTQVNVRHAVRVRHPAQKVPALGLAGFISFLKMPPGRARGIDHLARGGE